MKMSQKNSWFLHRSSRRKFVEWKRGKNSWSCSLLQSAKFEEEIRDMKTGKNPVGIWLQETQSKSVKTGIKT